MLSVQRFGLGRTGKVTRYNLAYVNHSLWTRDNGRVLGYDSAHGQHHRHYLGEVTLVSFESYPQIESRFYAEWRTLLKARKNAKD